ncbi:MAG: hypothetical protein II913_01530 [Elusimicrobiaceae bacterium]|nr:hypothetical protein [Elusimicrobiaceae bacterium]
MKKLLLLALVLCFTGLPGAAQSSTNSGVDVFAYSADQLATRFAGKTRKEVLSTINKVRSPDSIVESTSGKEYALVRYDEQGDIFRIFLFDLGGSQRLVDVADNASGALAMSEKYGINIPLPQKDVVTPAAISTPTVAQTPVAVQAPVAQTYLTTVTNLSTNQVYTAYQSGDKYLIFQNGALKHTFDGHQYAAFMATLSAANSDYQATLARQQQAQLDQQQKRLMAIQQANSQPRYERSSASYIVPTIFGTALLGTAIWSGIHYHHHHHRYAPAHHRPGPAPRPVGPRRR